MNLAVIIPLITGLLMFLGSFFPQFGVFKYISSLLEPPKVDPAPAPRPSALHISVPIELKSTIALQYSKAPKLSPEIFYPPLLAKSEESTPKEDIPTPQSQPEAVGNGQEQPREPTPPGSQPQSDEVEDALEQPREPTPASSPTTFPLNPKSNRFGNELFIMVEEDNGKLAFYSFASFILSTTLLTLQNTKYTNPKLSIRFDEKEDLSKSVPEKNIKQTNEFLIILNVYTASIRFKSIFPQPPLLNPISGVYADFNAVVENAPGEEYIYAITFDETFSLETKHDFFEFNSRFNQVEEFLRCGKALYAIDKESGDRTLIGLYSSTENGIIQFRRSEKSAIFAALSVK